ncbi:hypothetical protein ACHAWF_002701 [Thalassiosira exigua]
MLRHGRGRILHGRRPGAAPARGLGAVVEQRRLDPFGEEGERRRAASPAAPEVAEDVQLRQPLRGQRRLLPQLRRPRRGRADRRVVLDRERLGRRDAVPTVNALVLGNIGYDHCGPLVLITELASRMSKRRDEVEEGAPSSSGTFGLDEILWIEGQSDDAACPVSSSVTGGQGNTAGGMASTVADGQDNHASVIFSTASGGEHNTASLVHSLVDGGNSNVAAVGGEYGDSNSVLGGSRNENYRAYSALVGECGLKNYVSLTYKCNSTSD